MRGVAVMMLGLIAGLVLVAAVVVFVIMFYQIDPISAILKGFRNIIAPKFGLN